MSKGTPHIPTSSWSRNLAIVRELAVSDFRLKYHDSVLGYFWSMLNPLALFLVYHFVFSYLFVVEVPKFTLYLLSGIVFWNFFADATLSGMNALEAKASLTKKIYFPRVLIVVASTATALFSFLINTLILVAVVILFDHLALSQLLIVVPILLLLLLTFAVTLLLAVSFVYFRDTLQIWNVCLAVGFWLTPVVYNALLAPEPLRNVALLNPIGRILVLLRAYLVFDDFPPGSFVWTTMLFCLVLLGCGIWIFSRHEHNIPEYLS
jgi:lipopolysaccharide transport system permease protein